MATASRPDLPAYNHSLKVPIERVVAEAIEILGSKLVAYIAGVKETRAVREWASGEREIQKAAVQQRMRHTLHIAKFIADAESRRAAQSWMQGLNPQLNDRSAARLLREGDIDDVAPEIAAAARAFIIGG